MKKILFYINTIKRGGAERVMTNLSSQFAENGYETVFVTSFPEKEEYELNKKIKRYNLEEQELKESRLKRNISRIQKLRKVCKKERPDVLVSFMAEPNFRAIIATMGLPVKTIVSVRNDPNVEYGGRLMHFVGKWILPLADGCVFQTEDAKAWFPKRLQEKSTIIFNAVKSEFYHVTREPEEGLIVTLGRFQVQKNHKLLIHAMQQVKKKYPSVRLKLYGQGVLQEELEHLIAELGLQENVTIEGQTDNVAEALKYADIFAMTSDFEGMPNALMEALAVGVPSISTDCPCGGPRMLIEDGVNGLLFPVNDLNALVVSIEKLLENKALKDSMSKAARWNAQKYQEAEIFNQWKEYIQGDNVC